MPTLCFETQDSGNEVIMV